MMDASSDKINVKLDKPLTNIDVSSGKLKPSKKVSRSQNAFLIFAKEYRSSVDRAVKNDKSTHASTVVGSKWRELTDFQKAKYYKEAKRLHNLQMMSEEASLLANLERKSKVLCETAPENPSGHQRKKKNIPSSLISQKESQEVIASGKVEVQIISDSNETSHKIENAETLNKPSDPRTRRSNLPNPGNPHQQNHAMNDLPRMPSPVDPRHTSPCCYPPTPPPYLNSGISSYFNSGFPGVSQPCFGTAPLFPAYPLNAPPWMCQPAAAQWFPVCYPPPYSYSLPYSYSGNTFNGYINSYWAQYSRSVVGSTTYAAYQSTASATTASDNLCEECNNSKKSGETTEEEGVEEGVSDDKDDNKNGTD